VVLANWQDLFSLNIRAFPEEAIAKNRFLSFYFRGELLEQISWLSGQGHQVLLDRLQDGIFVIEAGQLAYVNQRLADMLGYPIDELIGRPFLEVVAAEDQSLVWERHHARLAGEKVPEQYDIHLSTARGVICCSLNVGLGESKEGSTVTVGSARDVTQQRKALAELEASKVELKSILDQLPDVLYRTDMQGIITMISPACFDIIGFRREEMLGTALSDYYSIREDRQRIVQAICEAGGKAIRVESSLRHKDGSVVWVLTNAFVRFDSDQQPVSIEGLARDISERKRMEEQLMTLSRTDVLTGAFSRGYFMEKCEEVINMMRRYQRPASMMVADLDHFKTINDKYGHHAGDLALKAFTNVCRQEIRESDILGRLGGEEFGLMLPETTIQHAQVLAERIRKAASAIEIKLDDQIIRIAVSIGLVELSTEDAKLDSVMRRADLAMYQAKAGGRNQVVTAMESDR
jgi:diguanylate cyclase (GGDEF)-like protein/PAS domain S-box-containing protein